MFIKVLCHWVSEDKVCPLNFVKACVPQDKPIYLLVFHNLEKYCCLIVDNRLQDILLLWHPDVFSYST